MKYYADNVVVWESGREIVQSVLGHPNYTGNHAGHTSTSLLEYIQDCEGCIVHKNTAAKELRKFRMGVLNAFFAEYPIANYMRDLEELKSAIQAFTTYNGVGWVPNRQDLLWARQRVHLLNRPNTCFVSRYYPSKQIRCYDTRLGRLSGWVTVEPQPYEEWEFGTVWEGWNWDDREWCYPPMDHRLPVAAA